MATYEPGTVAIATVRGVEGVRVFRHEGYWRTATAVGSSHVHYDGYSHVTDVRPLVVLDLAPDTSHSPKMMVEALSIAQARINAAGLDLHRVHEDNARLQYLINQIEAQTRPAITEPTGLGAVVEGREGNRWVRTDESHAFPWRKVGRHEDRVANWEGVNVYTPVRVLSEGWSE